LAYRPPYDWNAMLEFFDRRALPGIEWVDDKRYHRTVRVQDAAGTITVGPDPQRHRLELTVSPSLVRYLPEVVSRVRRQFDLSADPAAIAASLKGDAVLAGCLLQRPGLRLPGAWDPFEVLVRAVVGQQISVAGARTLLGRLIERYGDRHADGDRPLRLFPEPARLARARMNGLGITGSRVRTIRSLAQAVVSGDLVLGTGPPLDETVRNLQQVPGIGPWTAQYIAMRALSEPDAFPVGDLGLVRAWERLGEKRKHLPPLEVASDQWMPWRAYAATHLWASLDAPPKESKRGKERKHAR
jgi:AraC family transcriptional regulator of adaptative response / DNA-3-methyladenine glycosylase II